MLRRPLLLLLSLLSVMHAPAAAQSAAVQTDQVTLLPGDVIRVQIWREEDLSGEFPVDEGGRVILPLVGEKSVAGIPMGRLRDQLVEDYRVHLRNPSITITPLRRVNVLGEVQKPGMYTLDPTLSLAGAVALAGGANSIGDINRIQIIRNGQTVYKRASAGQTLEGVELRSGDQILVQRRSWFDRNSTFIVSTLLSATSIVIALVR
jgi:polysaccharide export outer membrane protein